MSFFRWTHIEVQGSRFWEVQGASINPILVTFFISGQHIEACNNKAYFSRPDSIVLVAVMVKISTVVGLELDVAMYTYTGNTLMQRFPFFTGFWLYLPHLPTSKMYPAKHTQEFGGKISWINDQLISNM